jgi:hypothetical protein
MAARCYRNRFCSFIHHRFFYALALPGASICSVPIHSERRAGDDKYL